MQTTRWRYWRPRGDSRFWLLLIAKQYTRRRDPTNVSGGAFGHYWIDFKNELVGLFVTHDAPYLDPRFMPKYAEFEPKVCALSRREMYPLSG